VAIGFALGVAYLILSRPTFKLLVAGGSLALVGVVLRAFAAGHLAKNQGLTTSGPYAYTRNPLYLGSLLMGLGFALAGGSWALGAAFLIFFLAIYGPVVHREAEALRRAFGEAYEQYARQVPLFVPGLRRARLVPPSPGCAPEPAGGALYGAPAGKGKFQWQRYRRNREYEAALGYLVALLFLALKAWLR
jgi:hypothetical protein